MQQMWTINVNKYRKEGSLTKEEKIHFYNRGAVVTTMLEIAERVLNFFGMVSSTIRNLMSLLIQKM